MELTHSFTVPADVDTTWATFMDLRQVGGCFPGATVTEADDEKFAGSVKVKLGPIALVYNGTGKFVSRDDSAHTAVIEAQGKDRRGNGTAGATVTIALTPDGDGTRADVATQLTVTGKPAQFGRGVMQDVSDKLLAQFIACIEGKLKPGTEDAGATAGPTAPEPSTGDAAPVKPSTGDAAPVKPSTGDAAPVKPSVADASAATPALGRVTEAAAPSTPSWPDPHPEADAIDLGATVLPVLVRSYGPYVAGGLVGLALGLLIGRRRKSGD